MSACGNDVDVSNDDHDSDDVPMSEFPLAFEAFTMFQLWSARLYIERDKRYVNNREP